MELKSQHSKLLELLAPARDLTVAKAAIAAGADAIFIGGPALGARAAASNQMTEIAALCQYAHRFGVRIHLTLNTLLYDDELALAQDLILQAAKCGVDALIVQDPAIFTLNIPPTLELHASTQCNIDSIAKLKFYADLGCAQAVLPRELSLSEIAAFHQAVPQIRLEVFVAGALCVGQSGICYISEKMTGRSANRGACAQICRLPMALISPQGKVIKAGHLLSLKDNLALEDVPALIAAGVSSFKIEGRLKDELYVKNQCAAFNQKLNDFIATHQDYSRSAIGKVTVGFKPDVRKTFNRGFTDAYLSGSNEKLYADKSPKFIGESCAQVVGVKTQGRGMSLRLQLKPGVSLHNGDAFTYFAADGALQGFRVNRIVALSPTQVQAELNGKVALQAPTILRRNVDSAFEKELLAPRSAWRQVELCCSLKVQDNLLTICYYDVLNRKGQAQHALTVSGDPLSQALMAEKCRRVGMQDYVVGKVLMDDTLQVPLALSTFNQVRRAAFDNYLEAASKLAPRAAPFVLPDPLPALNVRSIDPRLCLNARTRDFYAKLGLTLDATDSPSTRVLMTCRNCLIKNYARCFKEGGSVQGFKLKIGARMFKLRCLCRDCRMQILEDRT